MVNTVIVVGRLVKYPELQLTETGKKISIITLAVPRQYKNAQGEYEADFLDCTLWTNIAENTAEYCKTGDTIGIKGRIQSRIIERDDGSKYKKMEIVAERVNFIASAKTGVNKTIEKDDALDDVCQVNEVKEENKDNDNKSSSDKKKK